MNGDDPVKEQEDRVPRVKTAMTGSLLAACGSLAMADGLLQPHQWQSRILLVFASEEDSAAMITTLAVLDDNQAGIVERDLIIGTVFPDGGRFGGTDLSKAECRQLRDRFAIRREAFTAILIGKDGSEKLRLRRPPAAAELFELIDSMPMRQSEIRRRQPVDSSDGDEG
ncbi:MAG: DUF4174 domain-containing protein [Gammaproteobacteria bacterium]|nr:MAG: DUF4174 domain-containing protein [Gammaproteobacteria bacterium]